MLVDSLVEKINRLPDFKRQEVVDFVAFLEARYVKSNNDEGEVESWSSESFGQMSLNQAMRGLEDEPDLYSVDILPFV